MLKKIILKENDSWCILAKVNRHKMECHNGMGLKVTEYRLHGILATLNILTSSVCRAIGLSLSCVVAEIFGPNISQNFREMSKNFVFIWCGGEVIGVLSLFHRYLKCIEMPYKCCASSKYISKHEMFICLKLPSLFGTWCFWTFYNKSHNMTALVILSYSWSPFLPFTFFNIFLLRQRIYRSKYNISKGKTKAVQWI